MRNRESGPGPFGDDTARLGRPPLRRTGCSPGCVTPDSSTAQDGGARRGVGDIPVPEGRLGRDAREVGEVGGEACGPGEVLRFGRFLFLAGRLAASDRGASRARVTRRDAAGPGAGLVTARLDGRRRATGVGSTHTPMRPGRKANQKERRDGASFIGRLSRKRDTGGTIAELSVFRSGRARGNQEHQGQSDTPTDSGDCERSGWRWWLRPRRTGSRHPDTCPRTGSGSEVGQIGVAHLRWGHITQSNLSL